MINTIEIANQYIGKIQKELQISISIIENQTRYETEFDVYFYQTEKFIKTQNIEFMLAGNSPIIINKLTVTRANDQQLHLRSLML